MSVVTQALVLGVGALWNATGLRLLGRWMVARAGSGNDGVRRLALIMLVRAGDRGVDAVTAAYERGSTSTELPRVLASIESADARDALRRLTEHHDEAVRRAAQDVLGEAAS